MTKTFGTALNCIDGRTQIPVTKWLKRHFGVDYVDLITEPGMDRVLSQATYIELDRIRKNAVISIEAHHSKVIVVVGHYDCAANPVSDEQHFKDIQASVQTVRSWCLPVVVVGLWVDQFSDVYVIC
ncbi:carbonic anhydrase [Guptibacillus hwajinpoensis]|uniref:Peptidase M28 domain-containing protein n=1 Tax=Guptibacillus hwajinpoensis TaxID=208199 RepID=A0A0J6D4X3_9BACL|nr:carbonic anhydrase [Alkalihalobacillus macyae]KMM39369.1 hypothetical protein AB986_09230 [Alkalihalobacillus macyae]